MGMLTKFGTQWGDVPQTSGRIFWVAPASPYTVEGRSYSSSDNNDGLSPERALATIGQAITNAIANVGDVIMLMSGTSPHTSAATITLNKAGLTFVGCHPAGRISLTDKNTPAVFASAKKVQWTSTFAGAAVTNTASDCSFYNIGFVPLTAQTFFTNSAAVSNSGWYDCAFILSAAASVSTKGAIWTGAGDLNAFSNCIFYNPIGAQGPALDLTGATHCLVQRSQFYVDTGTWAIAIQLGAGTTAIIRDNDFNAGLAGVMTTGISGTGVAAAKSILMLRNFAGVSPGAGIVAGFGANTTYCELGNNYTATIGGGTGSTLITATT